MNKLNHSIKFLLLILTILLSFYSLRITKQNNIGLKALASETEINDQGLITIASPYSVEQTSDRLENIIQEKGLTLFTRIDHSSNAKNANLTLTPAQLLIFGNPQVGTPLMQCSITMAIDLPQKILVYQNQDSQTKIVYNQPAYLKQRHNLQECDLVLKKVENALAAITKAAIE